MSMKITRLHLVVYVWLIIGSLNLNLSLPCDDSWCRTGTCDEDGACICDHPDPSTILDGDRPFLGGKYCDQEMTMCDGTNSFWCEHGGKCEEIVQGEKYHCSCPSGYGGDRCGLSGARCGSIFCFNGAECLDEEEVCECPPDWRGSADCSVPTETSSDSKTNSSPPRWHQSDSSNNTNGVVMVIIVLCSLGAVVAVAFYVKKFFDRRHRAAPKFQQLGKMQKNHPPEEDETDPIVTDNIQSDRSHP